MNLQAAKTTENAASAYSAMCRIAWAIWLRSCEIGDPAIVGPSTRTGATTQAATMAENGYFVGLTISGGGSRSANFAAGCM